MTIHRKHVQPIGRVWAINGDMMLAEQFFTRVHLARIMGTHNRKYPRINVVHFDHRRSPRE